MNKDFKSLEDISEIIMGQSPPGDSYNSTGTGLPFFQGKSEFGEVYPTAVKWCTAPNKIAQAGDILISVRAPVGPTNLAKERCCIGRGLAAIRPLSGKIDRDFLWLQLQYLESYLVKKGQGSTFEAIGTNELKFLQIYAPEMEIQTHIVAKLKTQLAEVEKAQNAVAVQKMDAKFLADSQKKKALELLKTVDRVSLDTLLLDIETGKSMKTTELLAGKDELGVLKLSAISWNKFQPQEAKSIEGNYQPADKHRVKKGDLIISRANTIELVGAVVRVEKDYPNRLLSDKTLRLVVDEEQIMPEYLLHILKLPEARNHIEGNATGTSDSMRNISQPTIRSIPIPLPEKSVQSGIIKLLKESNNQIQRIEISTKIIQKDLDLLRTKILAQAFDKQLIKA
jgi:type I restriction enzyme S subunit